MMLANLLLVLMLQVPAPVPEPGRKVVVCLDGGQTVTVQDPEFSGFIDGHNGDAILMYRQGHIHGRMPLKTVSRIEFEPYQKGKPFFLAVTLRTGEILHVESEYRDHVTVRGKTEIGTVTIQHPDPVSTPVQLNKKTNRIKDLTIQYLEITGNSHCLTGEKQSSDTS
jgi:hypothetical protein